MTLNALGSRYSPATAERLSIIPWHRIAACYQFGAGAGTVLAAILLTLCAIGRGRPA
jgi:hypothetical protein